MTTLWKSMRAGLKSSKGNIEWEVGKWYKHHCKVSLCNGGFHASENIIDAMGFVDMEVLAQVEVKGKHEKQYDKQAWEYIKIVKAWKWEKKDSVALSIYAAELCIDTFEKQYPDDKRPRQAIEAAKKWLNDPTKVNWSVVDSVVDSAWSAADSAARSAVWSAARSAAWSAVWSAADSAADSAWSAARSAADSAARSAAWSAARSAAVSAARSAASAARSAARSAASAARSAAWSAVRSAADSAAVSADKYNFLIKCHDWIVERTKALEEIK